MKYNCKAAAVIGGMINAGEQRSIAKELAGRACTDNCKLMTDNSSVLPLAMTLTPYLLICNTA
jgi:hypothetical protein